MKLAHFAVGRGIRSGERLGRLDGAALARASGGPVELLFEGVQKTEASLDLRFSLAGPTGARVVAGSLYTYGEGCSKQAPERFFPMTLTLDITEAAGQMAGGAADVVLEIFDAHGRELKEATVFLESVTLQEAP
jgi:hypothetical protein